MTVATTTNKAIATGNGLTTTFPFTFGTLPSGDLVVTLFDLLGIEIPQTEGVDYTVLGEGSEDGGAVVFTVAPTDGYTVLIQRIVPIIQPTDYKNQGSFYPRTHERSFDRDVMIDQQQQERIDASITLPPQVTGVSTVLPAPENNTLFGWNEDSTGIKNFPLADIATSIAYGDKSFQTFVGTGAQVNFVLSQDPGSLGNLDVSIDGVTQVNGTDFNYLATILTFAVAPANGAVVLVRFDIAVPVGTAIATAIPYTPPSTGLVGSVKSFLDALWTAGASSGSALIRFIHSGVGAFARTVQDKERDQASVLDYIDPANHAGIADGSYTSNVSAGFNAALTAHKDVFIPAGIYTLTDLVTIPIGYRLYGAGRRKTVIKVPATFNLAALGVFRFAAGADGGEISDLTIEFTQPDSAVVGAYTQYPPAIYALGVPRFKVCNVRITQAWTGIDMRGNDGGAVIDDLELSAFNIGIDIDGALDTVRINNLHLWPFGIGNAVLTANQRTIYQEAYGVKCGKCDDFKLSNSLIFSVIKGLYFYESGSGYTFGSITNTALDDRGGLSIIGDGRLTYAGGSMSMGRTDSWFVNMTGGNLGIDAVRFSVSALQAVGNGLIELSGGTLSMGGTCLIEGAAHDKALVYAANAFFRATGVYFARNSGIAFASPMVRIINSGGSLTGCYASAIGAGSGKFAQIDTDNANGFVVRGNNLRGWSVQTPSGSALTNTMADANLGAGANKDTFCGYFSADATTTVKLPSGWSVAKAGTGNYTVTHNLSLAATTDMIPVGVGGLANAIIISDPGGGSVNTIKLRSYIAGVATDCDIHFHARRFRS